MASVIARLDSGQRRALLRAALGFSAIRWHRDPPPAARALATWMNSWRGIGAIVVGMNAQGFDVETRQLADHWRTNFYPTGIAHSIVKGSAWERTPWSGAEAAWAALKPRR